LRLFNAAYYHRQMQGSRRQAVHYAPFFYPLDGVEHWNRMYGRNGFFQFQCAVPPVGARDALQQMLREIAGSGQGSFLAVLKEFGDLASPGLLSFPRPGATLALDFPNAGSATLRLLDRLEAIVMAAGGALYPAKDARMSGEAFRRSFPRLEEFAAHVDPQFSSSFWRRVHA
jgi:FAD/FMN-containing dehydrogenase